MLKILEDACCSGSWDGQNLQIFGLTKLGQPWAWAWPCLVTMMATLASTVWDKPIPLIPCLSWSSATPVFTTGAMSGAIPWELLRIQYTSHSEYKQEIMKQLLICPKTESFKLGKDFALKFPESYSELRKFCEQNNFNLDVNKKASSSLQPSLSSPHEDSQINKGASGISSQCNFAADHDLSESRCHHLHTDVTVSNKLYTTKTKTQNISNLSDYSNQTDVACSTQIHSKKVQLNAPHPPKSQHDKSQESESSSSGCNKKQINAISLQQEANNFMRGVMDVTTFVGNFSVPVDTQMVIAVLATQDAYIPRDGVTSLQKIWPGMEVRYVTGGHLTAALFKQHYFRQAVNDAFQKYVKKYKQCPEQSREITS